ncbi:MAG: alkaline phosphatase family protein [Candidatus Aminicenantes bacterium]|nr:MAG: alkaline phosphatase family protein [Candidatus Aminicenantes bacterium]
MKHINRREFIKLGLSAGSLLALGNNSGLVKKVFGKTNTPKKVLVLGFDGVDAHLLEVWMNQGKLPNFQRLRSTGSFLPLRSSIPAQSPVAWSNFITGTDPGGHGIFDFLHRDPESYFPEFSASRTEEAKKTISIGDLVLPLSGGDIKNLRKGKAFWQILEDYDIPASIFKMPANYPPVPTKQRSLSGWGTPDILGTNGICHYYTTESTRINEDIGGARVLPITVNDNKVEAKLPGPINTFKKDRPDSTIDFKVFIDPVNPLAKIVIQDQEFILKEGEWSDWKGISFGMIPTQSAKGICKFLLKQVRPEFKLYVSPLNIDPDNPLWSISTPKSYVEELAKEFGPFYTKGLPADFNSLNHGILDEGEFLEQDDMVLRERNEMLDYELSRFDSGLLFYYLSSTDQRSHMFWRFLDKEYPSYDAKLALKYGNAIENIYVEADKMLARAMEKADKDTILIVMSDHGFTSFRRQFHLNTWLKENGYHSLINEWKQGQSDVFLNTNWSRTKAYALGLNGLYINQKGREGEGIVEPGAEKEALVREIAEKLENFRDSKTGEKPVLHAYVSKDIFHGPYVEDAPEIIVGYNSGYRGSWATPLGRIPKKILEDNTDKWSGDHCVSPEVTPGVFLANQKAKIQSPALYDVTATILKIFGIGQPSEMKGKPIF